VTLWEDSLGHGQDVDIVDPNVEERSGPEGDDR
jgi:hypothetical protein